DLFRRVNTLGAATFFDARTQAGERPVQKIVAGLGYAVDKFRSLQENDDQENRPDRADDDRMAIPVLVQKPEIQADPQERQEQSNAHRCPPVLLQQVAEKRRILLCAAKILRADVIEISAVRQRVLGDDINVTAIKFLVEGGLTAMWNETF